jgi:hypothetical protein
MKSSVQSRFTVQGPVQAQFRKRGEIEHSGDGWGWPDGGLDGNDGCWS